MKDSGRFIVGTDGKPVAVQFDEKNTSDAHSYAQARIAGRRFKIRAAMSADDQALLARLKPAEQNDLLDKPDTDRVKALGELREVASGKPSAKPANAEGAKP